MSIISSTHSAEDQCVHTDHTDEQNFTEHNDLGPPEDSEGKENSGPSAVKLRPGISNPGLSQPSEAHEQESVLKVALDGDLASGEKDQPTLNELADTMKKVLEVLQSSTIVPKTQNVKDNRFRFWEKYGLVAAEHDGDFLERYSDDMGSILLFSGLFSTVSSSFIVSMQSDLNPDPSDTTNALLAQLVQIGLGNFTAAGSTPVDTVSTWSPTASAVLSLQEQ
jgi:hypothetical protein